MELSQNQVICSPAQQQRAQLPAQVHDSGSAFRYTCLMSDNNISSSLDTETIEADTNAPTTGLLKGGLFRSFRYRNFTLFWLGSLASNIGTWMQNYALGIVVFALRSSSFDLGLVNFLSGIPVLFLALPAGALADRTDRRKLLLRTQSVLLIQAAALGVLYNVGLLSSDHATTSLILIASLGFMVGIFTAFQGPTFQSMVPELVPRPLLMNAIALNSAQFQSARMLGPLIAAALVLAGAGMGEVFYANAVSFLFVIAALSLMRIEKRNAPMSAQSAHTSLEEGAGPGLTAGVRYALKHRSIGVLVTGQAVFTLCGLPYMTLLPAIVTSSLGVTVGSSAYSSWPAYIMTANGIGALAGALVIAGLPTKLRRERIIPIMMLAFAISAAAFALSHSLWLTLLIAPLAGASFISVNSLTNTSIQALAPGPIRGRVMALFVMAFMGVMPLSGIVSGTLAQFTGPATAVIIGAAVICLWAGAIISHPHWLDDGAASTTAARQAPLR